jgi:hypothetical protein
MYEIDIFDDQRRHGGERHLDPARRPYDNSLDLQVRRWPTTSHVHDVFDNTAGVAWQLSSAAPAARRDIVCALRRPSSTGHEAHVQLLIVRTPDSGQDLRPRFKQDGRLLPYDGAPPGRPSRAFDLARRLRRMAGPRTFV